ncbi:acyltransferase [uncultured Methylobacterium sp.]|jgi:peptidoglycan/LPS O-acetylase OafA/YrhL|uniref:acyltransferase family protein n=1 Tax=uncultured Methylobacterium sp. TaxID=157278 RepID=UPI00260C3136|nr:acyltransferase [uncultured Methylobacterium sp.]
MTDLAYRPFGAFRLLLAVKVLQQHFLANLAPAGLAQAAQPYEIGSVSVLVFFALSGFVICEAADRVYGGRPGAFLANRLLRIVPLFVAATVLAIAVCWLFHALGTLRLDRSGAGLPAGALSARNLALNLLGFLPFSNVAATFNLVPVAWAVRLEMLFYLAVAVALGLSWLARRLDRPAWTFARTSLAVAALSAPLFVLAVLRRLPETFALAPYFWFGGALYFAVAGRSRGAAAVVAVSLGAIVWEFAARPGQHSGLGFERAVAVQFALLLGLLAAIAGLARLRIGGLARTDRALGDLTYALYLSHCAVMVAVLSVTTGFTLPGYLAGLALGVPVALGLHRLIEPAVDRARDAIRGGRLRLPAGGTRVPLRS